MDKSRAEGYDVSRQILRSLGRVARLHKKAPEHASLAVLKAPDIPRYWWRRALSPNHAEEKLLATASYQDQLAGPSSRGSATITAAIRPRAHAHRQGPGCRPAASGACQQSRSLSASRLPSQRSRS